MNDETWDDYLSRFHDDAPAVTERMLLRSTDDGDDPYGWAAAAIPARGRVLDLACGSAPLADHVVAERYVGVDVSAAELEAAQRRGARVVRANASAVPVVDSSVSTVVCSMGLMLTQPLDAVITEITRVLRPGGRLVALVPGYLPSGVTDALRWSAVFAALGRPGLDWPNPQVLRPPTDWLGADLDTVDDEHRTFRFPIDGEGDAEQFVASLYLRDVPQTRQDRAERLLEDWMGRDIGIPLRRLIARRA